MKWKIDPEIVLKEPSIAEIRKALEIEIEANGQGAREAGGLVRDRNFIHSIVCLRAALKIVREEERTQAKIQGRKRARSN